MAEFISAAYSVISGLLHLGLLSVGLLVGLSILAMVTASLRGKTRKQGKSNGMAQVHPDTQYTVRSSFRRSQACIAKGQDPNDCDIPSSGKPVAVLNFNGDLYASNRISLARRVDELLMNKDRIDGVIMIVNSPGGGVAEYGHAYAEMERIRNAGLHLTVCTDTYAASGGYLMSLPAHKIIAAPFAMVGSIGVVTEFLNFHNAAKKLGIEPLTLTAGEKKRSVTPLSEPTQAAQDELKAQLKVIHDQFKACVKQYRPQIDVDNVCTGQHWTAQESVRLKLGLVDHVATSQDFLFRVRQEHDLVFVSERQDPWQLNIFKLLAKLSDRFADRIADRMGGTIR